ncbi:MAG: hypothetical protein KDK76_03820 [Chlamydiia bacterium]|nr:hypothetical protein [Chlamydiia bacterium]
MEAIGVLEKTLPNAEYLKIVQLAKITFGILSSSEDALSFALLDEQLKSL